METGLSLLGFAWDKAIELLGDLENARHYGVDDSEATAAFWTAARQTLLVTTTVAQQALEFILKGRIAAVSPYLLIAGQPREWPRGVYTNVPFAEFRTIDAQDLIHVHDTVAEVPLQEAFVAKFDELRRKRNSIMHTVDRRVEARAGDILRDILLLYYQLFLGGDWVAVRRQYLERSPIAELHSTDFVEQQLVWEIEQVLGLLTNRQKQEYFGLPARQRKYICPECARNSDHLELLPMTAVLRPNASNSTTVFCFVCGETTLVAREPCQRGDCPGNVVSDDEGQCLTCGLYGPG
ncbi:MAG: hypothetical protein Q7U89_07955 [Coriobacteriia bacterium]|nr:hypothetical protein [Coriobacteriia bacterium]